jgi:hypothetical protein
MNTTRILAIAILLAACQERPAPPVPATPPAATPAEHILSPANGDTVSANPLILLGVTGEQVVPANGTQVEGEGHHHVFVDADLTPADSAIPKTPGIYHIGTGADSLRLEGLTPGRHRVIARFAYGNHVPMPGVATDTIWIFVQ